MADSKYTVVLDAFMLIVTLLHFPIGAYLIKSMRMADEAGTKLRNG
jgi:hypothetical protein